MNRTKGFSLVEMAIVLLIIGLMFGAMLQPLNAQLDISRTNETQTRLNDVLEALYGYAAANGRLPCPATATSFGLEAVATPATGACTAPYYGFLPAKTLGLGPVNAAGQLLDSWGQPIRYAVATQAGTNGNYAVTLADGIRNYVDILNGNGLPGFGAIPGISGPLTTGRFLSVCNSGSGLTIIAAPGTSDCGSAPNRLVNDALAVVYSTGPNGATGSGADESVNLKSATGSNNSVFVSHPRTAAAPGVAQFDDIVVWIPRSLLINKLVSAGRLP